MAGERQIVPGKDFSNARFAQPGLPGDAPNRAPSGLWPVQSLKDGYFVRFGYCLLPVHEYIMYAIPIFSSIQILHSHLSNLRFDPEARKVPEAGLHARLSHKAAFWDPRSDAKRRLHDEERKPVKTPMGSEAREEYSTRNPLCFGAEPLTKIMAFFL